MKNFNYILILFCIFPILFFLNNKNISIATDSYQILHYSTLKSSLEDIENKEVHNIIIGSCLGGYQLLDNVLFDQSSINLSSDSQSPFSSLFHLRRILKDKKVKNVIYQLDYDDLSLKFRDFNTRESLFDLSNIYPHDTEVLTESLKTRNFKVIIQDLIYYVMKPEDVREEAQKQKLDYYPTIDYDSNEYLHLNPDSSILEEIGRILLLLKENNINTIIISQPLPHKTRELLRKNNSSDRALEKISKEFGAKFINLNNVFEFQYEDNKFDNNRIKSEFIEEYNKQLKLFLQDFLDPL